MYRNIIIVTALIFNAAAYAQYPVRFPLKISKDKRYLVDQANKPFPILGRTAWFIITQSDSGYEKFLYNTIEHGYNSIEMAAIVHWPMGNHAPYDANGDAPFLRRLNGADWDGELTYTDIKNESPNLLTPNENYWKHVDEFLAYCEIKGILVFMFPGYVRYEGGDQGWMKELVANGAESVKQYGQWIANR